MSVNAIGAGDALRTGACDPHRFTFTQKLAQMLSNADGSENVRL